MGQRFVGLAIETSTALVDELSAELVELGATGVEVRDGDTHPAGLERLSVEPRAAAAGVPMSRDEDDDPARDALDPAWLRLRVPYGELETPTGELRSFDARIRAAGRGSAAVPAERATVLAWFGEPRAAEMAWRELARARPELAARPVELRGDEWRDRYRVAFRPFALTRTITVVPPWAEPPVPRSADQRVLWMDPGRAFGTGLHATTALVAGMIEPCAEALRAAVVLDVGTGSGILALVALLHGAARAVGLDVDEQALEVARANADRNGLSDRLDVSSRPLAALTEHFPWVLANIEARVLCTLADELRARVGPGGRLVLSGILAPQRDDVLARFVEPAQDGSVEFSLEAEASRIVDQDCWLAFALRRTGAS